MPFRLLLDETGKLMFEKEKLVNILNAKNWNKSIKYKFDRLFIEKAHNFCEEIRVVNFEYDFYRESDLYNSVINGAFIAFLINSDVDLFEYIEHVKSDYQLKRISENDLSSILNMEIYTQNPKLTEGLDKVEKSWILENDCHLKEVLILHNDSSVSYVYWRMLD